MPGGPADETGQVRVGDLVISVNGIYLTKTKTVDQVSSLILGPPGGIVELQLDPTSREEMEEEDVLIHLIDDARHDEATAVIDVHPNPSLLNSHINGSTGHGNGEGKKRSVPGGPHTLAGTGLTFLRAGNAVTVSHVQVPRFSSCVLSISLFLSMRMCLSGAGYGCG